ncbi:MAG TPA: regulator SirB [Gammaproteobacteria bacterium]|nr:regulator SirB [Gammaproteobacteria bacterium]
MDPLKLTHISLALASLTGFLARGVLRLRASPRLQARWLRILPHVLDSLLLATGIALAVRIGQYPFVSPWLTAKLTALVLYILLGMVVMRHARSRLGQGVALGAAVLVFAYMLGVAATRQAGLGIL